MGADEQLGGYSRHRGRFVSSGGDFAAVTEEIALEVGRISERNLGRDNRCGTKGLLAIYLVSFGQCICAI